MSNSFYALVLAGGSGTRFWPLSRKSTPKQLLRLLNESTLLEETLHRLEGLLPPENILILTNEEQEEAVRQLLKKHPRENIYAEPAKRDTAAAIALGVGLIAARDSGASMAVLPADHLIRDRSALSESSRPGRVRDSVISRKARKLMDQATTCLKSCGSERNRPSI